MQCIRFDDVDGECMVPDEPPTASFNPSPDDKKKYCLSDNFRNCPRYR